MFRISEAEKVMLSNEMIDQVDSFTYFSSILVMTVGAVKMLKVE